MDNYLIAKKTITKNTNYIIFYKYWLFPFLFSLIFLKISISCYVFSDEVPNPNEQQELPYKPEPAQENEVFKRHKQTKKQQDKQRETCEKETRQQYEKLYDYFYDKDTFTKYWNQRQTKPNPIFEKILSLSKANQVSDLESALDRYFNYLIAVLTTKYVLEEYNIQKNSNSQELTSQTEELSLRDEDNLKRTQLSSFQTDYSNLQFRIEFLNLFFKTLLELKEKQKQDIDSIVEKFYTEISNHNNLLQKTSSLLHLQEQPHDYLTSVNHKTLSNEITKNNFEVHEIDPEIDRFLAHGDDTLIDDFYGRNKNNFIDYFQKIIQPATQEVVLQNDTQINTNLPQLKDVYAKFILNKRCTIEDQDTLLKTITSNDSNNPNQNGMKEKLLKDLEKLHTNYEKIYQEQKETIQKYQTFLLQELKTQKKDITNRFKDRKPYEIYLQQENLLQEQLQRGIDELIDTYVNKPLQLLETSKNEVQTEITNIKKFIQETTINNLNTTSLKKDFDTFNNNYCTKREEFTQQQAKTKQEVDQSLAELKAKIEDLIVKYQALLQESKEMETKFNKLEPHNGLNGVFATPLTKTNFLILLKKLQYEEVDKESHYDQLINNSKTNFKQSSNAYFYIRTILLLLKAHNTNINDFIQKLEQAKTNKLSIFDAKNKENEKIIENEYQSYKKDINTFFQNIQTPEQITKEDDKNLFKAQNTWLNDVMKTLHTNLSKNTKNSTEDQNKLKKDLEQDYDNFKSRHDEIMNFLKDLFSNVQKQTQTEKDILQLNNKNIELIEQNQQNQQKKQKKQQEQNEIQNTIQKIQEINKIKETCPEPQGQEIPPVFNNPKLEPNLEQILAPYEIHLNKLNTQLEKLKQGLKDIIQTYATKLLELLVTLSSESLQSHNKTFNCFNNYFQNFKTPEQVITQINDWLKKSGDYYYEQNQ
ncbi:hypothetical protein [Mulberry dwarf phytoplasma]|uniref:hypothetical protein n=1 Tax=Mulberry dwarf phytoplasma TaxID=186171 RepID=UPI001D0FE375|nr:hypothetical protein [Mulberry dwarf phytoplasma]